MDSNTTTITDTTANTNTTTSTTHDVARQDSLNVRSCVTCRRRKVRCDKRHPCANCTRNNVECIFPGPGRAPRRARKAPDSELLARLRKLEGVVKGLGASVDGVPLGVGASEDSGTTKAGDDTAISDEAVDRRDGDTDSEVATDSLNSRGMSDVGRLVTDHGKSRYVSNSTWASLGDEVAKLRDLIDDAQSSDEDFATPEQSTQQHATGYHNFVFGQQPATTGLKHYRPAPSQLWIIMEVFKENVDPVVKVFHRQTLVMMIASAERETGEIDVNVEAVMFSICYSAITSLDDRQCQSYFGNGKDELLNRYRYGLEQALGRAGLLTTTSFTLLQGLVMFLLTVRRHDESRFCWTLTALAIRIAQSLGVHRDGEKFGLSPLETELRRRLWWHIHAIDIRSSEDYGCEPTLTDFSFDTKLPLNINDDDITADMKEAPASRVGCTEMTFSLIKFEIGVTARRIQTTGPASLAAMKSKSILECRAKLVDTCRRRMEQRYLQRCDFTVPIQFVSYYFSKLVLDKLWLLIHNPRLSREAEQQVSPELRDKYFEISIEVIEHSRILETHKDTERWVWLFRTYMQWHALVYVLSDLCTRPLGPLAERAWRVIDAVYKPWGLNETKSHMFWRPMRRLLSKALEVREKQKNGHIEPHPVSSAQIRDTSGLAMPTVTSATINRAGFGSPTSDPTNLDLKDLHESLNDSSATGRFPSKRVGLGRHDSHGTLRPSNPAAQTNSPSAASSGGQSNASMDWTSFGADQTFPSHAMNNTEPLFTQGLLASPLQQSQSLSQPQQQDPNTNPNTSYDELPWSLWDQVVRDYMVTDENPQAQKGVGTDSEMLNHPTTTSSAQWPISPSSMFHSDPTPPNQNPNLQSFASSNAATVGFAPIQGPGSGLMSTAQVPYAGIAAAGGIGDEVLDMDLGVGFGGGGYGPGLPGPIPGEENVAGEESMGSGGNGWYS